MNPFLAWLWYALMALGALVLGIVVLVLALRRMAEKGREGFENRPY
ncbi:MAG: hypothetical protein N2050_05550 [Flavobacteriales bacterium]|nr:hypothetical protein [Flavobacteriales bacterium]MCX7650000.1 hypothetical protein [Flavobacteriales bacterium]MDW8432019.1 hypothetical protein [Flavobacteriales bacterium]